MNEPERLPQIKVSQRAFDTLKAFCKERHMKMQGVASDAIIGHLAEEQSYCPCGNNFENGEFNGVCSDCR